MPDLVTFVFTDLVGSVDLKGRMPGAGAAERDAAYVRHVLTPHRERIEAGLADRGGRVVSTAGDGHFLAFGDTIQAALWAIGVQQSHADRPIAIDDADNADAPVARVRIGLHVGSPQIDPGDPNNFIGRAVDYAARLADQAVAGQILASRSGASLLEDAGLEGLRLHAHGPRSLRGIGAVEVFELLYGGREASAPRGEPAPGEPNTEVQDPRSWTVLPPTLTLTQYAAGGPAPAGSGSTAGSAVATPLRRVGNYELGELIGAGGMGNVYRARHTLFGRTRAVKIIKPELVAAGGDTVVRRFYQEVQATGAIEHPNLVVAIDSSAPGDDQHYLVMEYVDGVGVDRAVAAEGRLAVADACEIARQAALGLEHLHQAGLVHRDVKPSNLMMAIAADPDGSGDPATASAPRGIVKLLDLGLALLSRGDGQRVTRMDHGGMGTGHYMSPEQWRTTSVDIRADVYSLGCTLHHLLSGKPPFADSELRPEIAHDREPIPPLSRADVDDDLAGLIGRMMAKRVDDRPATPLEVARALAPASRGHRLAELVERHRYGARSQSELLTAPHGFAGGSGDTFGDRAIVDSRTPRTGAAESVSAAVGRRSGALWAVVMVTALCVAAAFAYVANRRHERMLQLHKQNLAIASGNAARNMAAQIQKRFRALERRAESARLAEWLTALREETDSGAREKLQSWIDREKSREDAFFDSNSWFITDARGTQLARSPASSKSLGKSYAKRDYFHGQGPNLDPEKEASWPPPPITEAHQSTVYKSDSTGDLKVAFSVPIEDAGGAPLGVLAMSVALGEFTALKEAVESVAPAGASIELLLVNSKADYEDGGEPRRGLVLQHAELERYRETPVYRLSDALIEAIQSPRTDDFLGSYADVFGRTGADYWGAYSRVEIKNRPSTGWVVIAQEPIP